jgi:hypothetical protein
MMLFNSFLMSGVDMVSGGMFGCLLVPLSGIMSSDSDVKTDCKNSERHIGTTLNQSSVIYQ